MESPRTIAITGATGLIGRALAASLASRGYQVRALIRRPDPSLAATSSITTHTCDLPGKIDPASLRGCDVLIHAAYVTRFRSLTEAREVNEIGTRRLFEFARKAGIPRLIFVSSTSAHAKARAYYGQSKRRMEQLLDAKRDLVIRPGLALSASGGLFARLARHATAKRWTIPTFDRGRQPMQTIHIDDLVEGFGLALKQDATGALTLASPERVTAREFFELVAQQMKVTPRFVNLPAAPTIAALRLIERLGVRLSFSSENVLGLIGLPTWETEPDLKRLGLTVRPLRESLAALMPP